MRRGVFAGCFVNWMGAGKTVALRHSVLQASRWLKTSAADKEVPKNLQQTRQSLMPRLDDMCTKRLLYLYDFSANGCEPAALLAAAPGFFVSSILAVCLLFAAIR